MLSDRRRLAIRVPPLFAHTFQSAAACHKSRLSLLHSNRRRLCHTSLYLFAHAFRSAADCHPSRSPVRPCFPVAGALQYESLLGSHMLSARRLLAIRVAPGFAHAFRSAAACHPSRSPVRLCFTLPGGLAYESLPVSLMLCGRRRAGQRLADALLVASLICLGPSVLNA